MLKVGVRVQTRRSGCDRQSDKDATLANTPNDDPYCILFKPGRHEHKRGVCVERVRAIGAHWRQEVERETVEQSSNGFCAAALRSLSSKLIEIETVDERSIQLA